MLGTFDTQQRLVIQRFDPHGRGNLLVIQRQYTSRSNTTQDIGTSTRCPTQARQRKAKRRALA